MDLAAADERHQLVAGLLQRQSAFDRMRCVACQLDGPRIAEEVRCVEHVDVERVALDPLAAVEQSAQVADRLGHLDAAQVLERVDRARLVRDRTDAADPRRDVRRLGRAAAAEEGFEEAGRLEDPKLDVLDPVAFEPHGHRTFALDPREIVGADHPPLRHRRSPPSGRARRPR